MAAISPCTKQRPARSVRVQIASNPLYLDPFVNTFPHFTFFKYARGQTV